MIVKSEETLKDALQMLETSPRGVRYSDTYAYIIIFFPENLAYQCRRALKRGDVVIAVPLGDERKMESQSRALNAFREERKRVKRRENPALAPPHKD